MFTVPPASIIAILFGMLALLKEPSLSERSSSPSRFTKPPSGINLNTYFVFFPCFFHIIGPKPIENSLTATLHNLATKKCPASCIKIRKPNTNIIFKAFMIKLINFLSPFLY